MQNRRLDTSSILFNFITIEYETEAMLQNLFLYHLRLKFIIIYIEILINILFLI